MKSSPAATPITFWANFATRCIQTLNITATSAEHSPATARRRVLRDGARAQRVVRVRTRRDEEAQAEDAEVPEARPAPHGLPGAAPRAQANARVASRGDTASRGARPGIRSASPEDRHVTPASGQRGHGVLR